MWPNPEFPADLVRFTEKILNEKNLFFLQCIIIHFILLILAVHQNIVALVPINRNLHERFDLKKYTSSRVSLKPDPAIWGLDL